MYWGHSEKNCQKDCRWWLWPHSKPNDVTFGDSLEAFAIIIIMFGGPKEGTRTFLEAGSESQSATVFP